MRRLFLVLAALVLGMYQALAGAFATKTTQSLAGSLPFLYYDMSGTGVGPWLPAYVCSDGAGNVCGTGAPTAIAPTQGSTWAQTTDKSCAAATVCALSTATSRKYFSVTNTTSSGYCRVAYNGVTPSASLGDPLSPAAAAGGQGGTRTFESSYTPPGTISAFCTVASTLAVMEGN